MKNSWRTPPRELEQIEPTTLCDWWFAEEAILIDTNGHYLTQVE